MQEKQHARASEAAQRFFGVSLEDRLRAGNAGGKALALFRETAETVPAYRAFLQQQEIDVGSVSDLDAFRKLPALTKQNYLRRFPLPQLCRNGRLEACDMIAVSSGSTGEPCFWPRFVSDELQIADRFEQIFHDSFFADTRRTLVVVCFALGTWVGGMYTADCCRHLAARGYPLTVITPGNHLEEILRVVRALGSYYDQVVLAGYPPFLKGVIDAGLARGLAWQDYSIRLVMAGEVFSEEWRALMAQRAGMKDICYDSASLYGTADAGVLACETPLSICIRRFMAENPAVARALFGEARLPTLAQYDPLSRFFENEEGRLLFTGDNGIPLIRYNILDQGGIYSYEDMLAFCAEQGFDPVRSLGDEKARGVRPLPFVYVFGRSDFTVSYFGANIYPENIAIGLEQPGIREWVTGKFVLQVQEDAERDRVLSVTVELAPGILGEETRRASVAAAIQTHLERLNSEFAHYVPAPYRVPAVTFAPAGDPEYFPVGVKHRYTRR